MLLRALFKFLAVSLFILYMTLLSPVPLLAAAPGQPFASYWHPSSLLAWNPATDPDAPYNRANTPLPPP